MSKPWVAVVYSSLLIAACATPYVPPKDGPTATLRLGGLLGSKGSTAYFLMDNAESCTETAKLAYGLKAGDANTVTVRADAPLVVEIGYSQLDSLAICRTSFAFTPESGAIYFLRLDEAYFFFQKACVPMVQKRFDEKRNTAVPFRRVCAPNK